MIDHVSIAVSDLVLAARFYSAALAPLDMAQIVTRDRSVAFGKTYPEFWLNARNSMLRIAPDSGIHICLRCRSKEAVITFHETALANGGTNAGAPGNRDGALTRYFGAFIFDLDGNRVEAATFPIKEDV